MPPLREFVRSDVLVDVHAWRAAVKQNSCDCGDEKVKLLSTLLKNVDWHEEQVRNGKVWNNYEELRRHCILDVKLLLGGLQKFRQDL